jgi:hypothetical protein
MVENILSPVLPGSTYFFARRPSRWVSHQTTALRKASFVDFSNTEKF